MTSPNAGGAVFAPQASPYKAYSGLNFVSHNRRSSLADLPVPSKDGPVSSALGQRTLSDQQLDSPLGKPSSRSSTDSSFSSARTSSSLATSVDSHDLSSAASTVTGEDQLLVATPPVMSQEGRRPSDLDTLHTTKSTSSNSFLNVKVLDPSPAVSASASPALEPASPTISLPPDVDDAPIPSTSKSQAMDDLSASKSSSPNISPSRMTTSRSSSYADLACSSSSLKRQHHPRQSIGSVVQAKRRLASAPFTKPPRESSLADVELPHPRPEAPRRTRSRHATRSIDTPLDGQSPLHLSFSSLARLDSELVAEARSSELSHPDSELARWSLDAGKSYDGLSNLVLTPTTEEWKQLGGDIGRSRMKLMRLNSNRSLNASGSRTLGEDVRYNSDEIEDSSSSSSGSDDEEDYEQVARPGTKPWNSSTSLKVVGKSQTPPSDQSNLAQRVGAPTEEEHVGDEADEDKAPTRALSQHRDSMSRTAASGLVGLRRYNNSFATDTSTLLQTAVSTSPVALDFHGPVDPRSYSARTGARTIADFVIESEAGKGAYGTVVRGHAKDANGQPEGPPLIIKYIIKQRILADCWKKHKILGPIPVEIHVLDHLRRIPYTEVLPWSLAYTGDEERQTTGHPNICSVLDFFADAEHYYLCMSRFGQGQDLFDYVENAPEGLPVSDVQNIFAQVASAITFLHMHGIVHRDIKDENVILDGTGKVQLIDFGSAAYVKEGRKFDTFSGTLDFAAPEVLRGERYDGRETDIWALGVLGYVLLCGECPFWNSEEAALGAGPSTRAAAALRQKAHPIGSTTTPDQLIVDAVDLISRCLEVDNALRPTAAEVCRHRFIEARFGIETGWFGSRAV